MCDKGPPSFPELETGERRRIIREAALSRLEEGRTYCVHFSSIREILDTQTLENRINSYPEGSRLHIEYFHEVAAGTPQDPRNLWLRKMDTDTDEVTITNPEEDPWDTDILLFLPNGATPVNGEPSMMDIHTSMVIGMVIGARALERDFSDQAALDRCKEDVHASITCGLGRVEAARGLDPETKHHLTMAQLKGMPIEMLDRKYNLYRMEHRGVNLDDYPQYQTYQTFYEMGIAPPTHQEMADIIIKRVGYSPAE